MLLDRASATQSFSDFDATEDMDSPAPSVADRPRRPAANRTARADSIVEGDQVIFARLDVAEALGIWRHALGRVVETHAEAPAASLTLDVKFDGHETLHRYLPDLFKKQAA
ncbi:hypothetical protein AFCDBAGC_3366 [Methylobacterium cerastii]|uniref:Uncharacterized protein n=1 Tax=Methylobacterium cerastii TaxID=932741 RepID=A0ABQ4QJT9_9HYPH|nr:hypothetical protein AFCDBAGC_3366 [Methylobacterium cerastii]